MEYFDKSLSRFVRDFACRDEVIAKFNKKIPISKIARTLSFPISEESIAELIWDYLIEKNIILLYEPSDERNLQYDYVKTTSRFGKTYFERVRKSVINEGDYELIDISELKRDEKKLSDLSDFERELLEKLPLKKTSYYVKRKERND